MSLISKKTFVFQADPDRIEKKELDFASRVEFQERLSEDELREYIRREMYNYQNQRLNDVSNF